MPLTPEGREPYISREGQMTVFLLLLLGYLLAFGREGFWMIVLFILTAVACVVPELRPN
jgi:hypothetical protein